MSRGAPQASQAPSLALRAEASRAIQSQLRNPKNSSAAATRAARRQRAGLASIAHIGDTHHQSVLSAAYAATNPTDETLARTKRAIQQNNRPANIKEHCSPKIQA